jgi:hypothetical protein
MFMYKFIGSMLVISFAAAAMSAEQESGSNMHLPLQPVQSFAVMSASGNNNTTVATADGWAVQTTIEAGVGYQRYLNPPYAGSQPTATSPLSKR